jgi:hypothetical protein
MLELARSGSTVTGIEGEIRRGLWHMAWWIGIILVATMILSLAPVAAVVAQSLPPESAAEQALQQRY